MIKRFDLGGAEDRVLELSNKLAESGHDVFLTSKPGRRIDELNSSVNHFSFNLSRVNSP